ncbi:hypothetical protein [Phenylobacterium sp.]|uniref:hypothetical protein n=1 Tax=Phenylobacterium sp. TaxID=1871053 RepID=UPI00272F0FB0|nr:hypothetical protein [Phenylobacterium sp.]MDP1618413.1 hypothetical protein [Phenylobacterium sp.]MDP1986170.1 hypothetical protein [Phenylobacterium sp.]
MRRALTGLALAMMLGSCGAGDEAQVSAPPYSQTELEPLPIPVTPPATVGFAHIENENLFGYYLPTEEIRIGDLRLDHIHIGSEMEFTAWEQGERMETYAPVMLEFADLSSPLVTNELGQEGHERRVRVLPTAYRVGAGGVAFVGAAPEVGEIRFRGRLDLDRLREAQASDPSGAEPATVLWLDGQIGDAPLESLVFFWFGGD